MRNRPGHAKYKTTPIKLFCQRMLLTAGAVLFTLGAAEIGLRIMGRPKFHVPHSESTRFVFTNQDTSEGPLYVNAPGRITFRYDDNPQGYFDSNNEVHHDVNPAGFRGPAFRPKRPDVVRLVFLGDSFTFGEGVRNQDTYPEVTAHLLREQGFRAESLNLGVGGYNTSQANDVLNVFGFDLQPDAVILGVTLNDAEPPLFSVDAKSGKPVRRERETLVTAEAGLRTPPDSHLYHLHVARAIWKRLEQRRTTKQTIDYYQSINADGSNGRVASEHALRDIIAECRKREIPCIVIMFPLLYELSDKYPFTAVHTKTGSIVREAGGHFIDILPALKGMDSRELIVHPTDQHPNETVHAIAARLLMKEIKQIITP